MAIGTLRKGLEESQVDTGRRENEAIEIASKHAVAKFGMIAIRPVWHG
jgi:hypothetical protein